MQLTATSLGSTLSNIARSCCGPSTQPQVARLNGGLHLLARRDGSGQVVHGRLDLLLLHARPRPAFGRPEPVIVQRVSLGGAAEDAFVKLLDHAGVAGILALRLQPFLDQLRER